MITVNNITYKDDFQDNNVEDKNYLRILFNGGRSVQIRELNQIQSILQSQIDKFGTSIYKQGAAVLGGGCIFDRKINTISFDNALLVGVELSEVTRLFQGTGDAVIAADVLGYDEDADFTKFYIRYHSGGGESSDGLFDLDAAITINESTSELPADASFVAGAFLSEGVFFVNGSFVVTPQQSVFIPITDEVDGVTGNVVLTVTESIVTYTSDQTLLDNAQGDPNHLAPGADRYQITLTLDFVEDGAVADTINRIVLLNIVDSNIVISSKSRYTDIDRQLAQRTSEESGNYILNPFKIEVKDLVDSLRPGSEDDDAQDRVYVGLDPSVAYVDGYRIELGQKLDLTADRARTFEEKDVSLSLNFGNFVDVDATNSAIPLPNTVNLTYELHNLTDDIIGTTRIKSVESVSGYLRIFLYDINLTGAYNLGDIDRIVNVVGGVDLQVQFAVQDTSNDTSVFPLPYQNVKSIGAVAAEDFSYVIKKLFTGVVSPGQDFTINTVAGETFEDASVSNFIVEVNGDWVSNEDISVVSTSSSSITIESAGVAWTAAHTIKVLFPVKIETNVPATKTLTTITDEVIAPTGSVYALDHTDIFDIVSVVIDGTSTSILSDIEISSDGQKPSHYTNGELHYIGAGTPPTIKVTYRHFAHSDSRPFTINSYLINWDEDDVLAANEIRYEDLPKWNSVSLGDAIDFRPTILGAGTITAIQPDPNSPMTCKPTFFLPRRDKVIVNSNGEFVIVNGIPNLNALAPVTPPASMALYELYFPAYTFNANDIVVKYIDNRRYTMRDIGKLDKRIENLEYYTSLSLLESSTNEKSIFDDAGQRFKNGMLIDSFTGHGIGDVFSSAYKCSIDRRNRSLRPFFLMEGVDLVHNAESETNIRINENTATLEFTETPLISQLVSSESESVNPYDVATFVGNVKLFPTNDKWIETNRRPDVIINNNGEFDAFANLVNEQGILGTEWNAWETDWTGVDTHLIRDPRGNQGRFNRDPRLVTTTTGETRTGLNTVLTSRVSTQNLGDRVIDISFVPFIRSRQVFFEAKGLKPFTRVYPFFDGIAISSYCKPEVSVTTTSQLTQIREYFGQVIAYIGNELTTDGNGELIGSFVIPNNNALKFRTGERIFKLTDSPTNSNEDQTAFAEGTYNASGSIQTVEATIVSTRVPQLRTDRVEESRVLVDSRTRWIDPLAQTFLINDIAEGAFVTSLDLWFSSKSATSIPVTIRIVSVENGYPTQRVIPFSEVTLRADDVNIWSADPDLDEGSTRFTFSDPVYLKGGVEYAIVILSNDPKYRIRVARLGGTGEDGKIIQQNPYGGVMFTSQNASTWSADQTRDFKFVLNRAVFDTELTGEVEFKSIMRDGVKSITVTNGGSNYTDAGVSVVIDAPIPDGDGVVGVQATAEAVIDLVSGTVIAINVTNPGSGYTLNPTPGVTITTLGMSGAGATATVNMYTAPTSAFSLMQGSHVENGCTLLNTLSFGLNAYASIDAGNTYYPLSEFVVTRTNRATITSTLNTSSEYISPVVDLDSMSLVCIHNQVNSLATSDTTELLLDAGGALSRYITREAELNDPADQLNIYLDVNRPTEGSNIRLYTKLKYDSASYSDWILVEPSIKIPITDNRDSYNEVSYVLASPDNDFVSFSIKIVFLATSTVSVVAAKNLRIIATS